MHLENNSILPCYSFQKKHFLQAYIFFFFKRTIQSKNNPHLLMQLTLFLNWKTPIRHRQVHRENPIQMLANLDESGIMQSKILYDKFQ